MRYIRYRKGFKYQLHETAVFETHVFPPVDIETKYISLTTEGVLTIRDGYAWDGASGPTLDTPSFMRGSLVHDALYQLMREQELDHIQWRKTADQELIRYCKEDGMGWWRRPYVYFAVRKFARRMGHPNERRRVWVAP